MRRILFTILIMSLLISCEKKLDYTLLEGENHLVVNSILNANADTILVNVSWSKPTAETLDTNLFVNDAQVDMYEDNNFLFDLQPRGQRGFYQANYMVKNGSLYTLKVEYQEQRVSAVTEVPQKPDFTSQIIDTAGALFKGTITVHDPSSQVNYYVIGVQFNKPEIYDTIFLPDTVVFLYRLRRRNILRFIFADFGPIEAKLPGIVDGFAFADKIFDGKNYTFHWYAVKVPTDTIFIQLYAIDRNLYKFFDTFTRSEIANNNPFAQPANVYTNIDGGLGLLASLTYKEDTLVLTQTFQ